MPAPLTEQPPPSLAAQTANHPLLTQLWQWADAGLLRRIDAALAQWVAEHDPTASNTLLLASALLSCLEGKGHTCLPLDATTITRLLGWPADLPAQTSTAVPAALATVQQLLPRSPQAWQAQLQSPLVWHTHSSPDQHQPLVLAGAPASPAASNSEADAQLSLPLHGDSDLNSGSSLRLHLRRYWQFEQNIAHMLHTRNHMSSPADADRTAAIAQWLDALFPAEATANTVNTASSPSAPFNWQKAACAIALRSRTSIITGGPGTGKTYTAARLLAAALALHPQPAQMRIGLAAPTGKAAARLKESIHQAVQDLPAAVQQNQPLHQALQNLPAARTLHSLLGMRPDTRALRYHAGNPLALDWLLVDEASMIHLEMMHNLLAALAPTTQLVLLGDKDQLASVEAGSVLGDFCTRAAAGNYLPETAHYLQQTTGLALPPDMLAQPRTATPTATSTTLPALAQHTVMLRQSRRFHGPIGALAQAVNQADVAAMQSVLQKAQTTQPSPLYWQEGAIAQTLEQIALQGRPAPASSSSSGNINGESALTASYGDLARALQNAPAPGADATAYTQSHTKWVRRVLQTLDRFRILCATREGEWGVAGANARVLQGLRELGIPVKNSGWFAGRVVQVTQNNPDLRIFNGDVGICLPGPSHNPSSSAPQQLRVYFPTPADNTATDAATNAASDTAPLHSISVTRLSHVETAFAMTVHKSQGSEFEHVLLLLPTHAGALLTRELVYTGLTRAKQAFTYLAPQPGAWLQATQTRTLRTSGLAEALAAAKPSTS